MFKNKIYGYLEKEDIFGVIAGVNFMENTCSIETEDGDYYHDINLEEVAVLETVFKIGEIDIVENDVIKFEDIYLLVGISDGQLELKGLKENLEFDGVSKKYNLDSEVVELLKEEATLVGNYYKLLNILPKKPSFNIEIIKDFNGENYTYFYACNNKEREEIDLIKVLFIGHQLIEDNYVRRTVSYDVYLDSLEAGTLVKVSQQELMNYALGVMSGVNQECDEEYCDEEYCDDCDCDCGAEGETSSRVDYSDSSVEIKIKDRDENDLTRTYTDKDSITAHVTVKGTLPARKSIYDCDVCGKDIEDCECKTW